MGPCLDRWFLPVSDPRRTSSPDCVPRAPPASSPHARRREGGTGRGGNGRRRPFVYGQGTGGETTRPSDPEGRPSFTSGVVCRTQGQPSVTPPVWDLSHSRGNRGRFLRTRTRDRRSRGDETQEWRGTQGQRRIVDGVVLGDSTTQNNIGPTAFCLTTISGDAPAATTSPFVVR